MASYTQLTAEEVSSILSNYFSYQFSSFTPLGHGISNTNYLVEFEHYPPVILKISNDKNLEQLQHEEEILRALKYLQYPYSLLPIKNKKDESFFVYQGANSKQYGVIFPYLQGKVASINENVCHQVGLALGELHACFDQNKSILENLKPDLKPYVRPYEKIGQDLNAIMDFAQKNQNKNDQFFDFAEAFNKIFSTAKIEKLQKQNFSKGIIHGDLYYDNVLFDPMMSILGVLDFEQAGLGPFILDIGIAISGTCLKFQTLFPDYIHAFLRGYDSQRTMSEMEREFLGDFINLGLFSIALWRIFRFDLGQIDKTKVKSYQELIKRALEFYENPQSQKEFFINKKQLH
jgi:homoserine kinase type II